MPGLDLNRFLTSKLTGICQQFDDGSWKITVKCGFAKKRQFAEGELFGRRFAASRKVTDRLAPRNNPTGLYTKSAGWQSSRTEFEYIVR